MFNIIIRRAVVATAGAGIALTLMAAPASAAPKADRGERQGTTATTQDQQSSTANVTVMVDCDNVVTVTSDKDISHVEWQLADGTVEKEEGLSGGTWTRTFDQEVVWAKAKSGETVVYGYPDCTDSPSPGSNVDEDVKNEDDTDQDVVDNEDDAEVDDKKNDDVQDDVDVEGDTAVDEPAADGGTTPNAIAPAAFKCGEVMATDVNGDGRVDAGDCTKVLGVSFERAPSAAAAAPAALANAAAPRAGAQVLGVQFEQAPAALARTGATFAPLVLAAVVLILSGVLMVHGRRRSTNQ